MPFRFLILAGLIGAISPLEGQEPSPADAARGSNPPRGKALLAEKAKREQAIREMLQRLPPEKRQQALAALRQIWDDQDVKAAREQLKLAAETYKRTMRQAIDETDPEVRETVRPLLERLMKDGGSPAQWGPGPRRPGDGPPRFLRMLGLTSEKMDLLTPDERRLVVSVRDRVTADERVKLAAARLEQAPDQPGSRPPALRELRRTARAVAVELEPRLAPLLDRVADPVPETRPAGP
jgi:hypothetical protein